MNPSRIFIIRPVATSLLMVAILLVGMLAFHVLPLSALPEVDYPTIQVQTFYPGASPEVMSAMVTAPLERQFGQMPSLTQMTSSSSAGSSVLTLQFNLSLGLDVAEQEVQAAINAAGNLLPSDLPAPPIYAKVNPADAPILTLAVTSGVLPLTAIQDLTDTRVAQKISQLPGVGLVSLSGGQRPSVRIHAHPKELAAYGLNIDDLRTIINTANVNTPKGNFDGPTRSWAINTNDQLTDPKQYNDIILAYKNGAPVFLRDVASVDAGPENDHLGAWMGTIADAAEPTAQASATTATPPGPLRRLLALVGVGSTPVATTASAGTTAAATPAGVTRLGPRVIPALIVNIQRQPGANVIAVADTIKRLLPELRASLPPSVDLVQLTDRTTTIRASVHDVEFELLLAIVLVILVIFLFLGSIPATIIPSTSVPLSLVGTFAVMYLLGFSLNNLSLMALTVATGFVVDDAIVMIENIARYIEEGAEPLEASLVGSRQIGFTILSLTISLIAVLIPLLFMGDVVGRLFREFAITLAVTILISAIVSLTLVPMMCSRLLKNREQTRARMGRIARWWQQSFAAIIALYGRMLRPVLDHPGVTLLVAVATLAVTVWLYVIVPKGFFPIQDTGLIQGMSEAGQTISYAAMAERQQAMARLILQDPDVTGLSSFIGVDGTNITLNSGRFLIDLKPVDQRRRRVSEIIRDLSDRAATMPGMTLYLQPVQDLTIDSTVSRTQYQFILEGTDPAELSAWTPKLIERLQQLPQITDVASDLQSQGLTTYITIDRDTAARFGISTATVDNALYDAYGQRIVSTIFTQSNQYRVILTADAQSLHSLASLNDIYLPSSFGGQVPLSSISHASQQVAPLQVNHFSQFPSTTISFNLAAGVSLGEAVESIRQAEASLGLPPSLASHFQGATLAFQDSLGNEILLIIAAIVTMYIVLGVLYESFIHPITILSTLPSAGVGALLALLALHEDLGIISIIGIILLIGIVKKNAIMMIDFALDAERTGGKSPREAIEQACLLRFRPILMTTMAALLGALPLMLGSGTGSELRRPLGVTIVGGLIFSQLLTLFTTPVIYLAFERLLPHRTLRRIAEPTLPGASETVQP